MDKRITPRDIAAAAKPVDIEDLDNVPAAGLAFLELDLPGTEADLDSVDAEGNKFEILPAELDLLGDPLEPIPSAREAAKRGQLLRNISNYRRRLQVAGVDPLDIMARCMLREYQRGNYGLAFDYAERLAPYTAPKLQSVMQFPVTGAPGEQAGTMQVQWLAAAGPATDSGKVK